MKFASLVLAAGSLLTIGLLGCSSSHQEGVKSDYRTQWTTVNADVKTTTDAAKSVLASSDLKEVTADSTALDGTASGKKADGTQIKVAIVKAEKMDNMSTVSVTVGSLGDPGLGADLAKKIKTKAEGK